MGLPQVTIEGRLTADPELRFVPSGAAVTNFRVATSERRFNKQSNEWEDGRSCFLDVTVWREQAENVVESLHKGDEVVVVGRLYDDEFTNREGVTVQTKKIDADVVSVGLRKTVAQARRTQRQQGGQPQGGQGQADPWAQAAARPPAQPAADPWAQGPSQGAQPPAQQQQQAPPGWVPQPPQQGAPPQAPPQQAPPQQAQPPQQGAPGGWGTPPPYEEPPF